jgi:hypothetical protein
VPIDLVRLSVFVSWWRNPAPGSAGIPACIPRGGISLNHRDRSEDMQAGMPAVPGAENFCARQPAGPIR